MTNAQAALLAAASETTEVVVFGTETMTRARVYLEWLDTQDHKEHMARCLVDLAAKHESRTGCTPDEAFAYASEKINALEQGR